MGATSRLRGTTHARSAREVELKVSHLMAHLPAFGSSSDQRHRAFQNWPRPAPVQSLRCDFPVRENHRHFGGLGWRDAVSGHKFEGGGCRKGAFLAPVSALVRRTQGPRRFTPADQSYNL